MLAYSKTIEALVDKPNLGDYGPHKDRWGGGMKIYFSNKDNPGASAERGRAFFYFTIIHC